MFFYLCKICKGCYDGHRGHNSLFRSFSYSIDLKYLHSKKCYVSKLWYDVVIQFMWAGYKAA